MTSTLTRFKFKVDNARTLASATAWAARSIPAKPSPPILGAMVLEIVEPGTLRVSGFDYDVCGQAEVSAEGTPAGRVLVSGRLLAEIAKTLPAKPLTAEIHGNTLALTCGTVRLALPLMTPEDYPALPSAANPLGRVDAQDFARLITRVASAADLRGEREKPALTGVHLDFAEDGTLTAIGTDRYRGAVGRITWTPNDDAVGTALVSAGTLLDLARSVDAPGELTIGLTDGLVSFAGMGRDVIARVIDAKDFPVRLAKVIPPRSATPVTVPVAQALTAVKRAALMLDKDAPVVLRVEGTVLTVAGEGPHGEVGEDLDCEHEGPPASVRIKVGYLTDALTAVDAARVEISFPPTDRKAALFTAPDDDAYAHFVQPVLNPKD